MFGAIIIRFAEKQIRFGANIIRFDSKAITLGSNDIRFDAVISTFAENNVTFGKVWFGANLCFHSVEIYHSVWRRVKRRILEKTCF